MMKVIFCVKLFISILCQGVFIHACQSHLVALEGNTAIFDGILSPLCTKTPLLICGSVPHATSLTMKTNMFKNIGKHYHTSESFDM